MKKNIITTVGIGLIVCLWIGVACFAWLKKPQDISVSERRNLAQAPKLSMETILAKGNNSFMSKFEKYTLDQFPLRDNFRQVKSVFTYYVMQQKDNNDIYVVDDFIAKLEYPLDETQLDANLNVLNQVYESTVKQKHSKVYVAVIPDKSYYLAKENGYLSQDYEKLFATVKEKMPWATYIDLTDTLDIESYYYTDTHWRQEKILPTAKKIAEAMGKTVFQESEYTKTELEKPFYGVYYGQAALPIDPETIYLMENDVLAACEVFDKATEGKSKVYDMSKLESKDLYEVYLSGSNSGVLEITNPSGSKRNELVIFRDSFSCSMAPLLLKDYYKVTLVDLRLADYTTINKLVQPKMGKDVLFLYSTTVLTGFLA